MALQCLASTGKVMAGCLVSHVPRWNLYSAAALVPHATVAVSLLQPKWYTANTSC